jgi:NTE family protein
MTSQTDALLPSAKEGMQKIAIAEAEEAEIGRGTKFIERAKKNRFTEVHTGAVPRPLRARSHRLFNRPPFECIALLLQGGGALGSYQAGVYEALAEADLHPDWVAGISIGAINSAIIAGNPPHERVSKLRKFWEEITANPILDWAAALPDFCLKGDFTRRLFNQISANCAVLAGAAEFFAPRQLPAWLHPDGAIEATSFYDTKRLRSTLGRFVDFDRINSGETRLSVGAVNVCSGNFVYFDSTTHVITPEHVMASGSLPPSFPMVEIEGEYYWDGGLISNTPLEWVAEHGPRQDTLAFQVDLWSARGDRPRNVFEVATRQKEIQYSSRTRANTDHFKHLQRIRGAIANLLDKLPEELWDSEEVKALNGVGDRKVYNLVHLIYRPKNHEGHSKDYEFSRLSMHDHWRAGYQDALRSLRHPEVIERPRSRDGVFIFDLQSEHD